MLRFASKASLLVVSIALSIAVFECGLRYAQYGSFSRLSGEHSLRVRHEVRGWSLDPGGEAHQRNPDFGVLVRINERGLRDREHTYAPEPGVFRVVVLGDSFMEAYQVPLEQALPFRLQEALADRRVEVINLGVGGYGTAQEYLALRDEGLRYQPDLVLLAFFGENDVLNNSRALEALLVGPDDLKVFGRPYAEATALEAPLQWQPPDADRVRAYLEKKENKRTRAAWQRFFEPALVGNLFERAHNRLKGGAAPGRTASDPNVQLGWPLLAEFAPDDPAATQSLERYEALWRDAWRATRRLMLEMQRLSADAGARFAVMLVPSIMQSDPDYADMFQRHNPELSLEPDHITRALAAFCSSHEIPFLDLSQPFAEAYEQGRGPLFYLHDLHWNPAGHELATLELARFLDAEHLIPPSITGQ